MSYILDALHKSEQERQEKQGPTLQTIHRPHIIDKSQNTFFWFKIIISSIVIFLVVGGGWLFLQSGSSNTKTPIPTLTVDQIERAALETAEKKLLKEPGSTNRSVDTEEAVSLTPQPSPQLLVHFWELPNDVQQNIPALTFSFHVFSENPERRTIIINKHRVKESEWVSKDLLLDEITKDGIILVWKERYRFSINVVENW